MAHDVFWERLTAGENVGSSGSRPSANQLAQKVLTMKPMRRRTFLHTTSAAIAAAGLASQTSAAAVGDPSLNVWKKAFMLGGLSKGSPLATFQLLKEAGFEGVELISPNDFDLHEVEAARERRD